MAFQLEARVASPTPLKLSDALDVLDTAAGEWLKDKVDRGVHELNAPERADGSQSLATLLSWRIAKDAGGEQCWCRHIVCL
jgi:hypothetical protein